MKAIRENMIIENIISDITQSRTDAIVNPANSSLIMGGGVAGDIIRAGGISIQEECSGLSPVECGDNVVTAGGRLYARWVIHAVGPRGDRADREFKLRVCAVNIVRRAVDMGMNSLAVPAISTGIFNYPAEEAVPVMVSGFIEALKQGHGALKRLCFVAYDKRTDEIFERTLKKAY